MPASGVIEVLRPYLWLALVAFLVGFLSYLAIGVGTSPMRAEPQYAPRVSAPVAGDWNLPKHV
jgi:hypothetical protein